MKICPFCKEKIQDEAVVCRYCKRDLPPDLSPARPSTRPSTRGTRAYLIAVSVIAVLFFVMELWVAARYASPYIQFLKVYRTHEPEINILYNPADPQDPYEDGIKYYGSSPAIGSTGWGTLSIRKIRSGLLQFGALFLASLLPLLIGVPGAWRQFRNGQQNRAFIFTMLPILSLIFACPFLWIFFFSRITLLVPK